MKPLTPSAALKEYIERSDQGDHDATIFLAWEYFLGEKVEMDVEKSLSLLKQAEQSHPELARFYTGKIMVLSRKIDAEVYDQIYNDCTNGFGPSCFLMSAVIEKKLVNFPKCSDVEMLKIAAENGHLISDFFLWRTRPLLKKILSLPYALSLMAKIMIKKYNNPRDMSVLT